MKIHEYQAKSILKEYNIPIQDGYVIENINDAESTITKVKKDFNSKDVVVKAQIHAGGRGKGTLFNPETREHVMDGGVKIAFSKDEVEKYSSHILGNLLVTIQTGDEGKVVNNLYIESGCEIEHEYYLSLIHI